MQPLVIGAALDTLAVLLAVAAWQLAETFDPGGGPGKVDGEGGGPRPILRVARRETRCDFGTPLWDEILGGAIGPGRWKLYEKGSGTTCGILVGYVLEQARVDVRLINRGDRFKIGAHISRLYEGGQSDRRAPHGCGTRAGDVEGAERSARSAWMRTRAGDVCCVLRDGGAYRASCRST